MILTTTEGQSGLPRYFAQVFDAARTLRHGRMDFGLPDGRVFRAEGAEPGPNARIDVHDPGVFARLVREGDVGWAEAYMDGEWSTPDLMAFMDCINRDLDRLYESFPGMGLLRAYEKLRFWMQRNTKSQARRNIAAHYDLGNEFYELWLDDTMTYSSAIFEDGQESHEAAQRRKYSAMVDGIGAQPGDHVLEIGCGWGGFAEYAAKERGLRVTGLTISQEQHDYARERMARAGLSDKVDIVMRDYRDETGHYDGIASIEMFEAVGEKYWPAYFGTLRDRLKPGKRATLQIITVPDARFEAYKSGVDFIQKYIFPGGMLPSDGALAEQIHRVGLIREGTREFAESYSRSLRRWHETFNERWSEIAAMGFDERFRRMWNYYLASCAGMFRYGNCEVVQLTVSKPA